MDDICRLCCSRHFVNNYIFDEKNALYLKMSLYLPIKVFKNDRLPQKICDKCSCKVNDLYQFCNESIEVQTRLNHILISSKLDDNEGFDITNFKENVNSLPLTKSCSRGTQTEIEAPIPSEPTIKTEPKQVIPEIKKECEYFDGDDFSHTGVPSDSSEEELLIELKKRKRSKKENSVASNGEVKVKRAGKKKTKQNDEVLPSQTLKNGLTVIKEVNESSVDLNDVTEEIELKPQELGKVLDSINLFKEKVELNGQTLFCCMCFAQCSSRKALLKHYKEHGRAAKAVRTPALKPPPVPAGDSPRCLRCQKVVPQAKWAGHWRRHFKRDTHPYRCALCEVTYRDHLCIMKHGLTHGTHDLRREGGERPDTRVYVCDLCPEGFDYMR